MKNMIIIYNDVRFNFSSNSKRTDKYGFTRDFKVYTAEKFDDDHLIDSQTLTKSRYVRKIMVNNEWEYFKARRKIDVEPVLGRLKAFLEFNRFSVRGGRKGNEHCSFGNEYQQISHSSDQDK